MSTLATGLSAEDEVEIKNILIGYRESGIENPLLPSDVDLDGDGTADSYGLDEDDNLIVVSGVKLDDTVYVSEGDDIRPERIINGPDTPKPGFADNELVKGR
jgi:hypothetical protein